MNPYAKISFDAAAFRKAVFPLIEQALDDGILLETDDAVDLVAPLIRDFITVRVPALNADSQQVSHSTLPEL